MPALARERFSENWQRLANKDQADAGPGRRRRLENFGLTRWLFSHGKLEVAAAAGTLLLVLLLVAAFICGRRILLASDEKPGTPEKPPATSR